MNSKMSDSEGSLPDIFDIQIEDLETSTDGHDIYDKPEEAVNRTTNDDIDEKDGQGWTKLHWAVIKDSVSEMLELLDQGGSCNVQDINGFTPLHKALECLKAEELVNKVVALLKHGAICNIPDFNGRTPLHAALWYLEREDAVQLVQEMLRFGANPSIRDGNGRTALYYAGHCSHKLEIGQTLISNGADPSAVDKQGRTVLHGISGWQNEDVIEYLAGL